MYRGDWEKLRRAYMQLVNIGQEVGKGEGRQIVREKRGEERKKWKRIQNMSSICGRAFGRRRQGMCRIGWGSLGSGQVFFFFFFFSTRYGFIQN